MKNISLIAFIALFTAACTSTSNGTQATAKQQSKQSTKKVAEAPAQYCQSMGGEVKTVGAGKDAFCILPGGEVVKLQTFYDNNH